MSITFAQTSKLQLQRLKTPRRLLMADNSASEAGYVTHFVQSWFQIGNHHWASNSVIFDSSNCCFNCLKDGQPCRLEGRSERAHKRYQATVEDCAEDKIGTLDISVLDPDSILAYCRSDGVYAHLVTLTELSEDRMDEDPITIHRLTQDDIDKFLEKQRRSPYTPEELERKIPKEHHGMLKAFSKQAANQLPPHRATDTKILLKQAMAPPYHK
ncbi:hypothetical protein K470DRAFT_284085 [Piedraia hortae CBS 480.64]|uniref:Uncharacterized protein n=1 Tax=Piedraia hortae CBS 480.64 TaxID=1314780 RepID=A0A6A7CAR5_9PEZI|nr:hypothetical protein K470DRAFT_284085 [Piedraia hortae CBS 480.64]